jgi:hypothetical protein
LTSDTWEQPQPPRIPTVISLAQQAPLKLRLVQQGLELTLNASSCEVDGHQQSVAPCQAVIRYDVNRSAHGLGFLRRDIAFSGASSADDAAIWTSALDRFFAESMRPLPKFRNSGFSQFLQLGYLNIDDGWLVVGSQRVRPPAGAAPVSTANAFKGNSQ